MKIKEKILEFVYKYKEIIFIFIISIAAFIIRLMLIGNISYDFKYYIEEWFYQLKDNGGLYALNLEIGNYNAPYMFILALLTYLPIKPILSTKIFSIIFDYVCAIAAAKIVNMKLKDSKNKELIGLLVYATVLFLPTVILNSAYWGQADSIYTAFILISLIYLIKEKYVKAFIFLGVSFAFKLQFIFILPLYILIYLTKNKISVLHFLIIPLVDMIMCLPAILFGKPIMSCINVYIDQANGANAFASMNFPGIWNLLYKVEENNVVLALRNNLDKVVIMVLIFIYIIIAMLVIYRKLKFDNQKIIEFGLLSVMLATFILPHMHERYLYVGDILSILYFIYNKDKIYVPIGISLVSLYGYVYGLFHNEIVPIQYLSILYLVILILVFKDIYNKYFRESISE